MLGPARTKIATANELCDAGRLIYGEPQGFSLYDVPAPDMIPQGFRFLCRTTIECCIDAYSSAVAEKLTEIEDDFGEAIIVDLFCGSGNFGYHLHKRLGRPVIATELDPDVFDATAHNFNLLHARSNVDIRLKFMDYREMLSSHSLSSRNDVYLVEPPWSAAFTPEGLDLTKTFPPVKEILDDIRRSRDGRSCLVAIKTNDQIANDSLQVSFKEASHLAWIRPPRTLPHGANMEFHIYRL